MSAKEKFRANLLREYSLEIGQNSNIDDESDSCDSKSDVLVTNNRLAQSIAVMKMVQSDGLLISFLGD